jgi:OmpA-OmpF porin, OOP family
VSGARAGEDEVNRLLAMVFGSQQSQVARAIAQEHGLKASSAMELLRAAVPLLLAWLAEAQSAGTLDGKAFADILHAEAPKLRGYLPGALLGSAAGVPRATLGDAQRAAASDGAEPVVPPRWLVPAAIAVALVLAGLAIRVLTLPKEPAAPVATVTAEATNTGETAASNAAIEAATAAWTALGDMMNVKLPDGSELSVPSFGLEARLVKFLNDGAEAVDNAAWFDFDRLLFATGKATLQSASQEQLTNIAAILKAYPQVRIRIGGYTDNTGDPGANLRLSEERANNVMDELVKLGIDPARMSARGYGAHDPIADNATEQGRQKNRRISLRVTDQQAAV